MICPCGNQMKLFWETVRYRVMKCFARGCGFTRTIEKREVIEI